MSYRFNTILTTITGLLAAQVLAGQDVGQPATTPSALPHAQSSFQQRLSAGRSRGPGESSENSTNLTKFDLDFPGGKPIDLVQAIEKASGNTLNLVITP